MLRGIQVTSETKLKQRLERYIDELNAEPVVFKWTYGINDAIRVRVNEEQLVLRKPSAGG